MATLRSQFNTAGMSPEAMDVFRRFEAITGQGFTINSAYRSPEHNTRVGGASGSQHLHGNALDISTAGMSQEEVQALIRAAREAGFGGIGIYDNALHLDVGPTRAWGPSYGRESVPQWAMASLGMTPGTVTSQPPTGNALAGISRGDPQSVDPTGRLLGPPRYTNPLQYGFRMT